MPQSANPTYAYIIYQGKDTNWEISDHTWDIFKSEYQVRAAIVLPYDKENSEQTAWTNALKFANINSGNNEKNLIKLQKQTLIYKVCFTDEAQLDQLTGNSFSSKVLTDTFPRQQVMSVYLPTAKQLLHAVNPFFAANEENVNVVYNAEKQTQEQNLKYKNAFKQLIKDLQDLSKAKHAKMSKPEQRACETILKEGLNLYKRADLSWQEKYSQLKTKLQDAEKYCQSKNKLLARTVFLAKLLPSLEVLPTLIAKANQYIAVETKTLSNRRS